MKKTKTNQILNTKKISRKPTSNKAQLLLLTTDYVTIQPLLNLYVDCVERMNGLLKMHNISADGPITWQDYDFWVAEFLKDAGFSQESADKLAPIYVCCWFEQSRIDMFGPEPDTPPIVYPKIIERDRQNAHN